MWIKLHARSDSPFAIKVYANNVNAISGENKGTDSTGLLRGMKLLAQKESAQDYIVTGNFESVWLDGIRSEDGRATQFVAMPDGTAEARLTGRASVAELRFEIVPIKNNESGFNIKILMTKTIHFDELVPSRTIRELKSMIEDREGIHPNQQSLFFGSSYLDNDDRKSKLPPRI